MTGPALEAVVDWVLLKPASIQPGFHSTSDGSVGNLENGQPSNFFSLDTLRQALNGISSAFVGNVNFELDEYNEF